MAIEDVKQLKTVNHQSSAQELLDQGWTLLGLFDRKDGNDQYVEYHLGRAVEPSSFFDVPPDSGFQREVKL